MNWDHLLQFASDATQGAGRITLEHFGRAATEFKADGSEVTVADRAAETFLRTAVEEAFPEDGILGEEGAATASRSGRRWIIDPIDGTRSFATGVPLYGVLLALEVEQRPVLGCAHFPVVGQTLVAATGAGAWFNGQRARVSECEALTDARVVTSGLEYWRDWASERGLQGWRRLVAGARFVRTWGDCFGYALVATGRADVLVDPASGSPWDVAPMIPILEEAGGRFTAIDGSPVRAWSTALVANPLLHHVAMQCWGTAPEERADSVLQTAAVRARREAPQPA